MGSNMTRLVGLDSKIMFFKGLKIDVVRNDQKISLSVWNSSFIKKLS
jgi:hypothetical protein